MRGDQATYRLRMDRLEAESLHATRERAAMLRWMERVSFRIANIVLAPNESHRRVAIERGGMDSRRVYVVRNGPKRAAIVPQVDQSRTAVIDTAW